MSKKLRSILAVIVLVALVTSGTFAWVSQSSEKNEFSGDTTPGGTLHDDFEDPKKEVYVENWGKTPIFVRIRLDEYMEVGEGAGLKQSDPNNNAVSLIQGADIDSEDTWETHIPNHSPESCNQPFHDFWSLTMGRQKNYVPSPEHLNGYVANEYRNPGTASKQTRDAMVVSMAQWITDGSKIGDFWVIDSDGWCYWAAPLLPGDATGLLLKSVDKILDPDDSYYYAINVIAQMATKGGDKNYTDWYSDSSRQDKDKSATKDGENLLSKIVGEGVITVSDVSIDATIGYRYGNKLYIPQGKQTNLTAAVSGDPANAVNWTVNGSNDITYISNDNHALVNTVNAAEGSTIKLTATSVSNPAKSESLTIVVIDKDAENVIKSENGKLYIDYGDNTFRQINDDGTTVKNGPNDGLLSGGLDSRPGNKDDRTDIVIGSDGTKYLGPNADDSYQKAGTNGKLGTNDDVKYWKIDDGMQIGPGNETTTQPVTQEPPKVSLVTVTAASYEVIAGNTDQFYAAVSMNNGSTYSGNVSWSLLSSAYPASISANGVLSVNGNAQNDMRITVVATADGVAGYATITVKRDPAADTAQKVANAVSNNTNVVIDGIEWYVAKTSPAGYAMLIAKEYQGTTKFSPATSTVYQGSLLQSAMTEFYTTKLSDMKTIAVIPGEINTSPTGTDMPNPTDTYAKNTSKTVDIAFAPTRSEFALLGYEKLRAYGTSEQAKFWTRETNGVDGLLYELYPQSKVTTLNSYFVTISAGANLKYIPAIWVKYL